MQKALTLSLVIPVYNEERHLKHCLDAVAAQDDPFDEIIVVDNNSKDRTAEIARQYKNVKVISESQQGVLYASRAGYNASTQEIICRIDADTIMPIDWAKNVRQFFADKPNAAAVTGNCYFYDFPFKRGFRIIHHAVYYSLQKLIAGTDVLWGSNMAMKLSAWQAVKSECMSDSSIHEDIDLSLHLKRHGLKIYRSATLFVGVSLRMVGVSVRFGDSKKQQRNLSPKKMVGYLWPWPKTYWVNRCYIQAVLIAIVLVIILVLATPVSLAVTAVQMLQNFGTKLFR